MIKRLMIVIIGLFLAPSMVFATNDLLNDLQAYYELEETGLNYADQTGSWPITNSQTNDPPSRVTGIINFGQQFSKSSTNDLVVPHDMLYDNINSDGNLTISGWVKGTNAQTNQIFGAFAADTSGQPGFINWFMYNGRVMVGGNDCANGGTTFNSNVGPAINDDDWHHVMIVYTNYNAQDVFIDGTYEGSTTNPYCVPSPGRYDPGSSATEQKFGSNPANGGNANQWSDYKMDEVGFWNVPLNQTHATALYNNGTGLAYSSFGTGVPPNTNPTITPIPDQIMNEDTRLNVTSAFIVGDAEDIPSALTLSYNSSNTALINATGSITFNINGTTGIVDMLDITPNANAFGTSNVDVTVKDSANATNTTSFLLTVFNINDAPTITPIANQTTTEGATLVINFNVTDTDNPFTDLNYTAVAGNINLIDKDGTTFSNYDGTNQTLTIISSGAYGVTDINVTVQDLQPAQASTQFQYLVNCNTTANYYTPMNVTLQINQGTTEPVPCLSQTFDFNIGTDILTYEWYDFGGTMNDIELYVYDATGNNRILINQTTLSTTTGTQTFDYSSSYQNNALLVIAELTDSTRSPFVGGSPARVLESNINQAGQLGTLFSDADGIIYGVLILLLFLTIGIASQSATLTLIFSVLGLFIASKFVLKIPSEFIWITGALVVILLYLIAKLRTD